jgi:hypothetical protein
MIFLKLIVEVFESFEIFDGDSIFFQFLEGSEFERKRREICQS